MRRIRKRAATDGAPDFRTLIRVLPDLWPQGRADLRWRVAVSLVLLVLAKLATIVTPFFFRAAVDAAIGPLCMLARQSSKYVPEVQLRL